MTAYNQHDLTIRDAEHFRDDDDVCGFMIGEFRFEEIRHGLITVMSMVDQCLLTLYDDDDAPWHYRLVEPDGAIVIHPPYLDDGTRTQNMIVGTPA